MLDRQQRLAQALEQRLGHVRVAIEAVYHRHNVSAILRTCDAMGIHGVHLVERHFRVSHGIARGVERWLDVQLHPTPSDAISAICGDGYDIWIADFSDKAVAPEQVPLERPVCLWFGAELVGVGPEAQAAATGIITIPMHGLAQSLNVSVAAALTIRPIAENARRQPETRLTAADKTRVWNQWMAREAAMEQGLKLQE